MTTTSETPAAPLVDLQRLFVTIRRRKRLWLATALLGLIAGALVAILLPAPPTAVAKVIVVHQDDSPTDSGTLMRTDVAVLSTTQIAEGALKKLNSTESSEEFMKNYSGLPVTNNVMQITVKAKSDGEAVAQAQALADTFIADHVERSQAAAAAQSKAILDQRKNAQDELTKVDAQIADETGKGRNANASTLEGLYGRRAALASQVSTSTPAPSRPASAARRSRPVPRSSTRPARCPRRSSRRRRPTPASGSRWAWRSGSRSPPSARSRATGRCCAARSRRTSARP